MQPSTRQIAKNPGPKGGKTTATGLLQPRLRLSGMAKAMLPLLLAVGLLSSCVTISPSTVELSSQVGERITEMEQMHQLAVQRYFDLEEQKVNDFMTKEWEPLFLQNFLATSDVITKLNSASRIGAVTQKAISEALQGYLADPTEVPLVANALFRNLDNSRSNENTQIEAVLQQYIEDDKLEAAVNHVNTLLGTDEPAKIILDFAEAAHQVMQAQRDSLLSPIRLAREEVTAELSAAYSELIQGQSIITGRLEAARKKSELQEALLQSTRSSEIYRSFTARAARLSGTVDAAIDKARARFSGAKGD